RALDDSVRVELGEGDDGRVRHAGSSLKASRHGTWAKRQRVHLAAAQLFGQSQSEAQDEGRAGAVGRHEGCWLVAGGAGDVQDAAALAIEHAAQDRTA